MTEGGFLGRWSARKRAEAAAAAAPEADAAAPAEGETDAAPDEPAIDEEALARLVPIDEATTSAELRGYLRKGVPEALQRAALRRVWSLNPAIRDYVDPARDYAWDFNLPDGRGAPAAAALVARLAGTLPDRRTSQPRQPSPPIPSVVPEPPTAEEPAAPAAAPGDGDMAEPEPALAARRRHGGATPR